MSFLERQAAAWDQIREQFEGHIENYNGPGSTMEATKEVREALPMIIKKYEIKSILDAPCGTFHWMRHINLTGVQYTGWDIDKVAIQRNRESFPHHHWECINILETHLSLPRVDLILCRDFFLHLPNRYIDVALRKFKNTGSKYLLTTNWPGAPTTRHCDLNGGEDDRPGYYCQPVDLEAEPFNLKGRIESFVENLERQQEMVLFRMSDSDMDAPCR